MSSPQPRLCFPTGASLLVNRRVKPYDLFSSAKRKQNVRLSPQFEKALIYATQIHGGKLRKKTRIPYIAHILGVNRNRAGVRCERNGGNRGAAARCGRRLRRRKTTARYRAQIRKKGCANSRGLHRHRPNAKAAMVGSKEGLRRTRPARVDVNKTRVRFGQTSQYPRDLNELPPGRRETLVPIQWW